MDDKKKTAPEMHGPVEVGITVHMLMPDGKTGRLTVYAEPGTYPSRAQQAEIVADLLTPANLEQAGAPSGTRAMTRIEFISNLTGLPANEAQALAGAGPFKPVPADIPHGMLVHAVMGVDIETEIELSVAAELVNDYAERGFMTINRTPNEQNKVAIAWNSEKLAAQPDNVLLAIYQRIVA